MTLADLLRSLQEWLTPHWPIKLIHTWERGALVRLGIVIRQLEPGLHVRWPIIEQVFIEDASIDVVDTVYQTVSSADGEDVTFSLSLTYRLADVAVMYRTVRDPREVIRNRVAAAAASEVLATNHAAIDETLGPKIKDVAAQQLLEWGVELIEVSWLDLTTAPALRLMRN